MKFYHSCILALSACATLLHGESAPSVSEKSIPTDHSSSHSHGDDSTQRLDDVVVTGLLDAKTTFDVAQGVTVLSGDDLSSRHARTLGESLSGLPGVASTYYGPGASRPIIRGLGGDRIRMLSDGLGTLDVSNVSPDHAVVSEPAMTDRIEVLRGPTTLLYGSSAVGGVVNVIDGRVPLEVRPWGAQTEVRWDSVSDGRTGLFSLYGTEGAVGVRIQGLRAQADDVRIPGFAAVNPGDGSSRGRLPGSSLDTTTGSAGVSYRVGQTVVGAAVSSFETYYGVPTEEEPIAIDLRQRRVDLEGESRLGEGWIDRIQIKGGLSDYRHHEVDRETGEIHTTFKQRGGEGRLEAHQRKRGKWTGIDGIQYSNTKLESVGEEVVTPEVRQAGMAAFTLQELSLESLTLQAGARVEQQRLEVGAVSDVLPAFEGYGVRSGETRRATSSSVAAGAVWYPSRKDSLALSVALSERLPTAQELFSNGPHGGTGAYEVGRSDLGRETALGVDVTYRRRLGVVTGSFGGFLHRFDGFIYEQRLSDALIPSQNNEEGLPVYQYTSADALFRGFEAEVQIHLIDRVGETVHLAVTADTVRADNRTLGRPLPRIPPWRVRSELRYLRGPWEISISLQNVLRQDRVDAGETETPGYALLGAEVVRSWAVHRGSLQLFLRGQNLGDEEARVHTSFLKSVAPLPGRNIILGARFRY